MHTGVLLVHLHIPGCRSLKEKRSQIKPLQERLRRQFNVTIAEVDFQDIHDESLIAIGLINNKAAFIQSYFDGVVNWIEMYFSDLMIEDQKLEIF